MTKYILLKSDSTILFDYDAEGLEKKQKAVGGLIQPVHLETGLTAYINEEGLLINLPVNHIAIVNFRNYGVFEKYLFENHEILGNVLYKCESKTLYDSLKASLQIGKQVMRLENNIILAKS